MLIIKHDPPIARRPHLPPVTCLL